MNDMIQANELRIGNWVQNNSEYICITNFDAVGVNFFHHASMNQLSYLDTLDRISPIPLTPEILEKCGFVRYESGSKSLELWDVGENPFIGGAAALTIKRNTVNGVCFFFNVFYDKLKYLHQLQNLYFALTGTELTYTP